MRSESMQVKPQLVAKALCHLKNHILLCRRKHIRPLRTTSRLGRKAARVCRVRFTYRYLSGNPGSKTSQKVNQTHVATHNLGYRLEGINNMILALRLETEQTTTP